MARTRIGSAEIDLTLTTGRFERGVEAVKRQTKTMADRFKSLRSELNTSAGQLRALGAIAGAGYTAQRFFELGAAVEETASKFGTVFGPEADKVNQQLERVAMLSGLTNQRMQEIVSTTGAMLQGFGFTQQQSAALSTEIQKLAADLGSFNNIPVAETSQAIQAALTGEREQLKRLGIVLRETDVQQRAMLRTGKDNAKALTDQEKALASYELIVERAGVAIGDLERTSDSAAAQMRVFEANIGDIANRIASFMLPVMNRIIEGFNSMIQWIQSFGASAAVLGGQIELLLAKMKFWDKEGIERARQNLAYLKQAAEEVKDEIAGFGGVLEAQTEMTLPDYSDVVTAAAENTRDFTASAIDLSARLNDTNFITENGITLFEVYALNVRQAAEATNALADAQQRLSAVGRALGFLGRFVPAVAGIASGFGAITGAIGIGRGLIDSFGGGQAAAVAAPGMGEINLNLNVQGVSDGTVQNIRGRLRDFNNLDVPLVV